MDRFFDKKHVLILLLGLSCVLLGVFLWWHLRLGLTRYFDVDEFAYLHWAHNIFVGKRPYVDFFYYATPGFIWILSPLYGFFSGTGPLLAGRILAFVSFVGLCTGAGLLFWEMRKSWIAIVAPLVLAFLPMPFDKFIEIRPDTLAFAIAMFGLFFQIRWMRNDERKTELFWSGILYGISLLILQKVGLQVAIAGIVVLLSRKAMPFVLGLVFPLGTFVVWMMAWGGFNTGMYSITKLPFEVGNLGKAFGMMPDLFFYPNQIYYGQTGISTGLLANHALWIIGLGVGIWRLLTPYLIGKKQYIWSEVLISSIFITHVLSFIYFYPMRHPQYLIPVAVFVSWYVADGVFMVFEKIKKSRAGLYIFAVLMLGGFMFLHQTIRDVTVPKLAWSNKGKLAEMQTLWTMIPKNSYVFDLEGATLYYEDPYYVSSLPFGQWAQFLSRPLPPLAAALEKTETKYIYQGHSGRLAALTVGDQEYIKKNFIPIGDGALLMRK